MCHMQEWLLNSCYSFELSPLNELYRGKLVSSIIVNIPYLLASTLSIISSNIYTMLAFCNCLSFTMRSGDLPSLLMDIFSYVLLLESTKDRKNISIHASSAPPSYFGTGHKTVLFTPPRKAEYARVLQCN